jgi:hypothetical protein
VRAMGLTIPESFLVRDRIARCFAAVHESDFGSAPRRRGLPVEEDSTRRPPDRLYGPRVKVRGRAMRAWIDRTNDGLSGMPADGISLPVKKGGPRHVPLGRLEG